ncbi:helix-turn-helix domain-containing protein [Streptomyces albireticuli]|uniref:Transcriptional regulator n=1 Tax=Streptomyces albireticuli TaxID=1940 RepID=A0A2A2DDR2_9ACTN|nr:helix-turn-helix transcriptional regulator [Streptomyces albireticuli]MCD9144684.1 helix-turn-helix domain-containing protein [Streptomyces albireticuli]MCD9165432.1 helix-turn-helix domain-containing protein [Streptomyces albireticuli]MCD9193591.1 helix-turn-helix domain-containing protein [Streptomyces albireticuli]PAU49587.1 transcriptional regulator [Streptomyces albireticuli]
MPDEIDKYIGARIAERRADRGLTQQGLAMRAHVSKSLLSKVECGQRPASPELVAACARGLGVMPADLLGQPYLDELRRDQLDLLIQPIREALNLHNLGHDPSVRPRPLEQLAADRDRICLLVHETDLRKAAAELPALMVEAIAVAHATDDPRAWALLGGLDRVAFNVAAKFGFHDLSLLAAGRAEYACERAQDPSLAAMAKWMHTIACLRSGEFTTGKRLHALGIRYVEDAAEGPERDAVMGQMNLAAALLDVRCGEADAARGHLEEAERFARRTGDVTPARWLGSDPPEAVTPDRIGFRERGVHWYVFGPTNVAAHRISALADQNDHAQAVRVGRTLRIPQGWPAMRAGQVHIDLARSHLWTGQDEAAFRSLLDAQRVAPQQTRYHPQVRETVVQLRKRERQSRGTLAHFAEWVGV